MKEPTICYYLTATHIGNLLATLVQNNGKQLRVKIEIVKNIPNSSASFISLNVLADKGFKMENHGLKVSIYKTL